MPSAKALTVDPAEKAINLRGTIYRFRELTIGEYDDLVKLATSQRPSPVTGADVDVVDNTLLLRLMVLKCCVEPKLTQPMMNVLPMPVVLKINDTVNQMHYGDEPELAMPGEETKEEGDSTGNG